MHSRTWKGVYNGGLGGLNPPFILSNIIDVHCILRREYPHNYIHSTTSQPPTLTNMSMPLTCMQKVNICVCAGLDKQKTSNWKGSLEKAVKGRVKGGKGGAHETE